MIFNVSPAKESVLLARMAALGIRESEIEETFVRAAKSGGQKVNKTSVAVYLKHLPTGIEVKCQTTRSQALNRFLARRILVGKIGSLILGKASEARQKIEKIRRQKRRRSRRSKEKMLEAKRMRSEKKELRRPVHPER
jgi:protein subunit release factor B